MSQINVKASEIEAELAKGGNVKEIAKNLNLSVSILKEACKAFNISLRKKPRLKLNFVDDRGSNNQTEPVDFTVDNTVDLTEPVKETFTESLLKKPKKSKEEGVEVKVEENTSSQENNLLDIEL